VLHIDRAGLDALRPCGSCRRKFTRARRISTTAGRDANGTKDDASRRLKSGLRHRWSEVPSRRVCWVPSGGDIVGKCKIPSGDG